jgi:peptidoglycan/LPS O-acetylase OafA/YrhL
MEFNSRKQRLDIQFLRGIAVTAVILFHNNESFFPNGYLGVDIFFVVSGFVVTPKIIEIFLNSQNQKNSVSDAKINMRQFFLKRFMRLVPALSVTLTFFSSAMILIGPISEHTRTLKQAIATFLIAGNVGAWRYSGEYFSSGSNAFVHTWSLSVEEQIYILIPFLFFLIFFIFGRKKALNESVLTKSIIILIFFSFTLCSIIYIASSKIGLDDPLGILFYFPFTRLPEFLLGSLVYLITKRSVEVVTPNFRIKGWIYLFVLVSILIMQTNFIFPKIEIITCIFTALVIKEKLRVNGLNIANKIFVWLGDRSYSLYLVHMPIYILIKTSPLFELNQFWSLSLSIFFTLMLGMVLYKFVESRFRILQKKNPQSIFHTSFKVLIFIFAPLVVLLTLLFGVQHNYFGAHAIEPKPVYAGSLGDCSRDNSFNACKFSVKNPQSRILLIGDSQAGSISESFIQFASNNNLDAYVWARTGCRFILKQSLDSNLLKRKKELQELDSIIGCNRHNDRVFEWIRDNANTQIVLMNSPSESRFLVEATSNTASLLEKIASKVLVIGSVPFFGDGNSFFSQNRSIWGKSESWPKKMNQKLLSKSPFIYNDFLRNKLARENVLFLDPTSVFCGREECFRWYQGNWLYSDVSHLSLDGAKLLFNLKINVLKSFLLASNST